MFLMPFTKPAELLLFEGVALKHREFRPSGTSDSSSLGDGQLAAGTIGRVGRGGTGIWSQPAWWQ